jgi:alginate O-acetyltransferase complex protein AlgI
MTLSRWLRDYLYIPLGGNRHGAARTLANLMTTMLLGGLWHGASWTFIVWGGLHGIYLVLERVVASRVAWWHSAHWLAATTRWLVVFNLVCFAWVFFRAPDFASSMVILEKIIALRHGDSSQWQSGGLASLLVFVVVLHLGMARWRVKDRLADANALVFSGFAAAMMLALIWFAPAHTVPFIYFQF